MYQNSKINTWYKVKEWHKKTKEKRKPIKNMWIVPRYWGRCVSKYHERAKIPDKDYYSVNRTPVIFKTKLCSNQPIHDGDHETS